MATTWTTVPTPDGSAYIWALARPATEQDAWAGLRSAREGESFFKYRAWCVARLGRRPVFDAQDPRTRRLKSWMFETLPVAPEDGPRVVALLLASARLFRAIAAAYLFWDDDDCWAVAAALLANGWTGSDRELYASVLAATT